MERRDNLEIARVKAFSDGVFAIAATLPAFNVKLSGQPDLSFGALLVAVCLMPFATGLIGGFHPGAGAFTLYASTMALIGVLSAAQWAYAALRPGLISPHATPREMWAWFFVACVAPSVFLASTALASWSVPWAMRSWILLLLFLPLARRVTRR